MDYKKLFPFLLFIISTHSSAQFDDPTRPADYIPPSQVSSSPIEEEAKDSYVLKLSAIFTSPSFKHAIINGLSVQQGDIVFSNIEVLDIQESSVTVLVDGQAQELLLSTPIKRTQQGF